MSTIGPKLIIELVQNKATGEFAASALPHPHLAGLAPEIRVEPRDLKITASVPSTRPAAAEPMTAAASGTYRDPFAGTRSATDSAGLLRNYHGSGLSDTATSRIEAIIAQNQANNAKLFGR